MTEEEVIGMARARKGWAPERARDAVRKIMDTGKWSLETLYIGFRADFQCEYCGRPLLRSPEDYKLWEKDHIVAGGGDDPANLALACTVCNCKFKNSWWHSAEGSAATDRQQRIQAVQRYIKQRRDETAREVEHLVQILN
jgi:5-methylcytosine-specific restriction endonuclease McrA